MANTVIVKMASALNEHETGFIQSFIIRDRRERLGAPIWFFKRRFGLEGRIGAELGTSLRV